MVTNPIISLSDDLTSARASWNFLSPMTFDGSSSWSFVRYEDDYVRVGTDWKVKHMRVSLRVSGDHNGAWKGLDL
jgi:hypothetical protein